MGAAAMRGRYTDPVENLLSYIMVHGGIDRHERMEDVQWVRDVVKAAKAVSDNDTEDTIKELRRLLRDYNGVFS